MRVLVACEFSGIVRDAFRKLGHDAWSCDLLPPETFEKVKFAAEMPECECCGEEAWCEDHECHFGECNCLGPTQDNVIYEEREDGLYGSAHYQQDVLEILDDGWDLMIAHPPCTYLCSSGMHWTVRGKRDPRLTEDALDFVQQLLNADIPRIALENPIGVISKRIRKPECIIHPWKFGHPESKTTCLWLKNLPVLKPTNRNVEPRRVGGKNAMLFAGMEDGVARWENQCDDGQNKVKRSTERWKERSRTYQGIADAMAAQWGNLTP